MKDVNVKFTFESLGNGTCYISNIDVYTKHNEMFDLVIPEVSPEGDVVVAIRSEPLSYLVPLVITDQDYQEILSNMQKAVDSGELTDFTYRMFQAFFLTLDQFPEESKEFFLSAYPVAEIADVWVVVQDVTPAELVMLADMLFKYANYTNADLIADYENVYQ